MQARDCNNQNFLSIQGVGQAYDFGESSASNWNLKIWYNDSAILRAGQQPPPMARVNKVAFTPYFLLSFHNLEHLAPQDMEVVTEGGSTCLHSWVLQGDYFLDLACCVLPVSVCKTLMVLAGHQSGH